MAILSACTPPQPLPTVMVLPSPLPTLSPTPTQAVAASAPIQPSPILETPTSTHTATPSPTVTLTSTAVLTRTPTPTKTLTPTVTPTPERDAIVNNEDGLNLRKGPDMAFEPPLGLLDDQTPLKLLAISPNFLWYKVKTPDGREGWAYSKLLEIYHEPDALPVVAVPFPTNIPVIHAVQGAPLSIPSIGGVGGVPQSQPIVTARVLQLYQQGLQIGNNPRMFAKVGDSITNNQSFMLGYGMGQYNLGGYSHLQDTINYFSPDAFRRDSLAAESGFNAAAVMDSVWAPPGTCMPNESPLLCEYRIIRPSVAIIMFGSVDVQLYDANSFNNYLSQVVNITTSQGIIPVLTTFPYATSYYPSESEAFNNVIRNIAASQQIPLIDLQAATTSMPDRGVGRDMFHLTQRPDEWINLTGDENQYGTTRRNLLTLQTLDSLRIGLGMN